MTMSQDLVIYTIGHSDHSTRDLIALLKRHRIACVIDVRSQPYSRWANQFNRETLAYDLQEAGLDYQFLGDAIGGRPDDPSLYGSDQERPNYGRTEQTERYQAGIDQLLAFAGIQIAAMMCSEGDHRQCHRHMLITQTLLDRDVQVRHIQPDGTIVPGERIPKQLSLFG